MNANQPVQSSANHLGSREHKRKVTSVLIHKPMQREFSIVVIVLFMISIFATGFVIHYTIKEAAFGGGFHFGKINPYEVLAEVSYQLIFWVSCILFATLLVIAFFGIFFLHRAAGPVHRFFAVLRRINEGQIPGPFKLRDGDFFVETADELNLHLKTLAEKASRDAKLKQKLEEALQLKPSDPILKSLQDLKGLLESPSVRP